MPKDRSAYYRAYREAHKDELRAYYQQWRDEHREEYRTYQRVYHLEYQRNRMLVDEEFRASRKEAGRRSYLKKKEQNRK